MGRGINADKKGTSRRKTMTKELKAKIKDYPLQSDNRNVKGRKKE